MKNVYEKIKSILENARNNAYLAVNFAMVSAYWHIGKIIVEEDQKGKKRAEYGRPLIKDLSLRLKKEYGQGFTERNIRNIRSFYLAFPKWHALRTELAWTHYRLLLRLEKEEKKTGDNPAIGIILCSDKNETMVKYTMLEDKKGIFASKYRLYLPSEEELKKELIEEKDRINLKNEN